MANETGVPALIDLQVLSPMAWVKREKDRIGATPEAKRWIARDYLDALRGGAAYAGELSRGEVPHGEGPEGNRRRLEFTLIRLATDAVLLLEKLRSGDFENQMVNKDGSENDNG